MNIGLTYDLRSEYLAMGYSKEETAEFDRDDTVSSIDTTLQQLGFETERIGNVSALTRALHDGKRWDLVFNIAEGLYGYGRESMIPCLLEHHRIPYTFSDPLVLAVCLHKEYAKRLLRSFGIPTPDFTLINNAAEISATRMAYPLFAKPVAEGTSKGITKDSIIHSDEELNRTCSALLKTFRQPVLVETFLPGREFTVGVVGTGGKARCAGVMEVLYRKPEKEIAYSYENKENYEQLIDYRLVDDPLARSAADLALKIWRILEGRDAGRIDFREDSGGRMQLIELNPMAGLHPTHSDLPIMWSLGGRSFKDLIGAIMDSVLERIAGPAVTAPVR